MVGLQSEKRETGSSVPKVTGVLGKGRPAKPDFSGVSRFSGNNFWNLGFGSVDCDDVIRERTFR